MTSNKEDYLKALYELGAATEPVSTSALARYLGVSAASVSEMLPKLSTSGWVEYRPYRGATFTAEGREICGALVQSHRLWEVFLVNHLGLSWKDAHEQAHLLEHATSPALAAALDRWLGYPVSCPHGNPIPRGPVSGSGHGGRCLTGLRPGLRGRLVRFQEDDFTLDFMDRSGLALGDVLEVYDVSGEGVVTVLRGERRWDIPASVASGMWLDLEEKS